MSQAIAPVQERKSPLQLFSDRLNIDPAEVVKTLKATAFRQSSGEVSDAQMTALLIVANQYRLNPWTKELYAYPDKGGIVPVVSVDGWARIINEHPELDGIEFRYAETIATPNKGKPCPEWCECIITRKDRAKPIVVREYLDEVFRELSYANPWQSHTKRMLRHKTLIQCARLAFGFSGIYDDDEAQRIIDGGSAERVADAPVTIEGPSAITPQWSGDSAAVVDSQPQQKAEKKKEQGPVLGPAAHRTLEQILVRCGFVNKEDGSADPSALCAHFKINSPDDIRTPDTMNEAIEWIKANRRNAE